MIAVTAGSVGLAFLAGVLSILSPCVLPLLPIAFGAAASEHRLGPAALAAGLSLSFVAVGLFVALIGFAVGLDADRFRTAAAVLLALIGVVLLAPPLQARLAQAGGPLSARADRTIVALAPTGLAGQFAVGALLGAVWSPCVGPTLGAASLLAAQAKSLPQAAFAMLLFGCGAGLPLLALGLVSRRAIVRWRHRLLATGKTAKSMLGVALVAMGFLTVTGLDKQIEAALVAASPQWLTELSTAL